MDKGSFFRSLRTESAMQRYSPKRGVVPFAEKANPKSETQLGDYPALSHGMTPEGSDRFSDVIHSVRFQWRRAIL